MSEDNNNDIVPEENLNTGDVQEERDIHDYTPENVLDDNPEMAHPDEPKNKIKRNQEVNLTQKDPTIRSLKIGVGWDLKAFDQNPLDLDASIFLLDFNDQTRVDDDFIFYNNLRNEDSSVHHKGDNRTGAGDGDDEIIDIDLQELSFEVSRIAFVLSIYDEEYQDHNFSMVKNVYFRIVNKESEHEIFRYELDEELDDHEGLVIGFLERIGPEWVFRAAGETVKGGLATIADQYGIIVAEKMG